MSIRTVGTVATLAVPLLLLTGCGRGGGWACSPVASERIETGGQAHGPRSEAEAMVIARRTAREQGIDLEPYEVSSQPDANGWTFLFRGKEPTPTWGGNQFIVCVTHSGQALLFWAR